MTDNTSEQPSGHVRTGVVFPTGHVGNAADLRRYVAGVEDGGVDHLLCYDHVLGASPEAHPGWTGQYDIHDPFHEPLVLFGFLAAVSSLELATHVLVLPQRQTALVAKQAAEIDVLTGGGRLRLGIGIGWNEVEYDGLGIPFHGRGRRLESQLDLLRRLWSGDAVEATVGNEHVRGAGLNPLPRTPSIPIWLGARSRSALLRVGRLADGWMPYTVPGRGFEEQYATVAEGAADAGRDPHAIGIQGVVSVKDDDPGKIARQWARWAEAGATHIAFNTIPSGARTVDDHLRLVAEAARAVRSSRG